MFFTRPNLPALGLDLVEVEGGGSCPAQFFGKAVDGRQVYIRYRGGSFSVTVNDASPDHWSFPGNVLLQAQIGPFLHGDMLLEQACDLAGITVRGDKLVLTEEKRRQEAEKARILDWSGRVTYWQSDLQVSETGGRYFVECLEDHFPDLQILTLSLEPQTWRRRCELHESLPANAQGIVLGIGGNPDRVAALKTSEYVRLADLEDAFDHSINFGFEWNGSIFPNMKSLSNIFSEELERKIILAEGLKGSLATQYRSADPGSQDFIDTFISVIDSCFSDEYRAVDLRTGEVVNGFTDRTLRSNDLMTWGDGQTDYYLSGYRDGIGKAGRLIGIRPLAPMEIPRTVNNG